MIPMRSDLLDLFELDELHKYLNDDELTGFRASATSPAGDES
jgi:hypothetical protein